MHKSIYLFLLLTLFSYGGFGQTKITRADFENTPPGTKKIIEARYYQPIEINNTIVCGEEVFTAERPGTIYYLDKDGYILLEKHFDADGHLRESIRNEYVPNSKERLLRRVSIMYEKENGGHSFDDIRYLRDSENRLLEVKLSNSRSRISCLRHLLYEAEKYEYDNAGNCIKRITNQGTIHIQKPPVVSTIETTVEKTYGSDGEVREKKTLFYDKKTNRLIRTSIENCEYGYTLSRTEYNETYNSEGKVIKEVRTDESIYGSNYSTVNPSLSRKEQIQQDVRKYGSSLKKTSTTSFIFNYDKYGNETSMEWTESGSSGNRSGGRKAEFDYNSKGDWIKCIHSQHNRGIKQYDYVCVRTITYLN